jgi:pSer/pThr/pTyr-binding forkhead associated (FHA) protein
LIAVAIGYAGFRYAQNKGFTVVGMLTKAGVTLPKDPDPVPQAQRPGNSATSLPPLPGLDALPSPTPGTAAPSPTAGITASGPLVLIATDGQASGKRFKLSGTMTIGREMSCNIPLSNDQTISRNHAEVLCSPDGSYTVTDKGSSNGTFVNSSRVTASAQLVAGDTLVVGAQRFRVEVDA